MLGLSQKDEQEASEVGPSQAGRWSKGSERTRRIRKGEQRVGQAGDAEEVAPQGQATESRLALAPVERQPPTLGSRPSSSALAPSGVPPSSATAVCASSPAALPSATSDASAVVPSSPSARRCERSSAVLRASCSSAASLGPSCVLSAAPLSFLPATARAAASPPRVIFLVFLSALPSSASTPLLALAAPDEWPSRADSAADLCAARVPVPACSSPAANLIPGRRRRVSAASVASVRGAASAGAAASAEARVRRGVAANDASVASERKRGRGPEGVVGWEAGGVSERLGPVDLTGTYATSSSFELGLFDYHDICWIMGR